MWREAFLHGRRPLTGLPSSHLQRLGSSFPSRGARPPQVLQRGLRQPRINYLRQRRGAGARRKRSRLGENQEGKKGGSLLARRPGGNGQASRRPEQGRIELRPIVPGGSLGAGSLHGRGFPVEPGWGPQGRARPPSTRAGQRPAWRRAAGAGRGAWPAAIRATPSPGRGARREPPPGEAPDPGAGPGTARDGGSGGVLSGGTRSKPIPSPAPPHLVFPSAESEQDKGGEGGPCRGARPPAHKGRGPERWAGAGGGAGGEGQTVRAPPRPPAEADPSRQREGVGKGPESGEVEAHPAEIKRSPLPAAKCGRRGWGRAPRLLRPPPPPLS